MNADPEQLAQVADVTGQVITAIAADQWALPTPCAEWNVEELVEHLVIGNTECAAALGGDPAPATPTATVPPAGIPEAYRRSVRRVLDAFGRPDVLRQQVTVPFGTVPGLVVLHLRMTELLVHGWDLARVTGQRVTFPEHLAEQELAFTRPALADVPADRRPFDPPRPVADDAPAIDRLAACLGRSVTA